MNRTQTKSVRLKDIARRAEISVAAVSMALADHPDIGMETKMRVRELSRQMGYRQYTAGFSIGRLSAGMERIGYVQVGGRSDNQVHGTGLSYLVRHAAQQEIRVEVTDIESISDMDRTIQQVVRFGKLLNGLILSGYADRRLIVELIDRGVPHVILGHVLANLDDWEQAKWVGHCVASDEMLAGRLAVRRLMAAGHRRIAFTCEQTPVGLSHWQCLSGYKLAHMEAGLPIDPDLVTITGQVEMGGAPAVDHYLSMSNPPTAHVVPDIRIAHTMIQAFALKSPADAPSVGQYVICGLLETARMFGVSHYTLIAENSELLTVSAINRLRELIHHPVSQSTQLILPPILHNFSM